MKIIIALVHSDMCVFVFIVFKKEEEKEERENQWDEVHIQKRTRIQTLDQISNNRE